MHYIKKITNFSETLHWKLGHIKGHQSFIRGDKKVLSKVIKVDLAKKLCLFELDLLVQKQVLLKICKSGLILSWIVTWFDFIRECF